MGNTLGLKVTCFRVVGLCKFLDIDRGVGFGRGSFGFGRSKRTTNRRPDLSIIAPGRCAARMPGTGPLRRSSGPARKKAIVGKSRVEATRLQRLSFVFLSFLVTSIFNLRLRPTHKIFRHALLAPNRHLFRHFIQAENSMRPVLIT